MDTAFWPFNGTGILDFGPHHDGKKARGPNNKQLDEKKLSQEDQVQFIQEYSRGIDGIQEGPAAAYQKKQVLIELREKYGISQNTARAYIKKAGVDVTCGGPRLSLEHVQAYVAEHNAVLASHADHGGPPRPATAVAKDRTAALKLLAEKYGIGVQTGSIFVRAASLANSADFNLRGFGEAYAAMLADKTSEVTLQDRKELLCKDFGIKRGVAEVLWRDHVTMRDSAAVPATPRSQMNRTLSATGGFDEGGQHANSWSQDDSENDYSSQDNHGGSDGGDDDDGGAHQSYNIPQAAHQVYSVPQHMQPPQQPAVPNNTTPSVAYAGANNSMAYASSANNGVAYAGANSHSFPQQQHQQQQQQQQQRPQLFTPTMGHSSHPAYPAHQAPFVPAFGAFSAGHTFPQSMQPETHVNVTSQPMKVEPSDSNLAPGETKKRKVKKPLPPDMRKRFVEDFKAIDEMPRGAQRTQAATELREAYGISASVAQKILQKAAKASADGVSPPTANARSKAWPPAAQASSGPKEEKTTRKGAPPRLSRDDIATFVAAHRAIKSGIMMGTKSSSALQELCDRYGFTRQTGSIYVQAADIAARQEFDLRGYAEAYRAVLDEPNPTAQLPERKDILCKKWGFPTRVGEVIWRDYCNGGTEDKAMVRQYVEKTSFNFAAHIAAASAPFSSLSDDEGEWAGMKGARGSNNSEDSNQGTSALPGTVPVIPLVERTAVDVVSAPPSSMIEEQEAQKRSAIARFINGGFEPDYAMDDPTFRRVRPRHEPPPAPVQTDTDAKPKFRKEVVECFKNVAADLTICRVRLIPV